MVEKFKVFITLFLKKVLKSRSSMSVGTFKSYEDALNFCDGIGYEASEVVKVVIEKNQIFRDQMVTSGVVSLDTLRTMIGVGALNAEPTLRVLDFGGGGGSHYSIVRAVLGADRDIRWNVVETSTMVKAANERLAGGGIKFFDDIQKAATDLGQIDLVFTSGALQYTPDPLAALSSLLAVKADHLFITRTTFSEGPGQVISVQTSKLSENGPGPLPTAMENGKIRYPVTFASKLKALNLIRKSYIVRFSVDEERDAYTINGESFNMYGYFCDLKK